MDCQKDVGKTYFKVSFYEFVEHSSLQSTQRNILLLSPQKRDFPVGVQSSLSTPVSAVGQGTLGSLGEQWKTTTVQNIRDAEWWM